TPPPSSTLREARRSIRLPRSSLPPAREKSSALRDSVPDPVLHAPELLRASRPLRCGGCSWRNPLFPSPEPVATRPAARWRASAKNLPLDASAEYPQAAASTAVSGRSGLHLRPFLSIATPGWPQTRGPQT